MTEGLFFEEMLAKYPFIRIVLLVRVVEAKQLL